MISSTYTYITNREGSEHAHRRAEARARSPRDRPTRRSFTEQACPFLISASTISPTGSCLAPMDRAATRSKGLIGCAADPR